MNNTSSAVPMKCANLRCNGYAPRHEFENGEPMYYVDGDGPYCAKCLGIITRIDIKPEPKP